MELTDALPAMNAGEREFVILMVGALEKRTSVPFLIHVISQRILHVKEISNVEVIEHVILPILVKATVAAHQRSSAM